MDTLNRKAIISADGLSAQVYYKGEWLTVNLRFNFWQWCECELAELQRSRTVLGAMPDGMEANLEKLVTAEAEAFEAAKGRQPMRERVGAISERVL